MASLLFLRPYRSLVAPSARAQAAYLRLYHSCRQDQQRLHRQQSQQQRRRSIQSAGRLLSADSFSPSSPPAPHVDRSAIALRVKELSDAEALHYPRFQSLAHRQSVPTFRRQFASVSGSEGVLEVQEKDGGGNGILPRVELSGRVLSVQRLGAKLMFFKLLDEGEQVQIMCNLRQLREAIPKLDSASPTLPGFGLDSGTDSAFFPATSPNPPVSPSGFKLMARLLRRGDHVAVTGRATRTATGELTLAADTLPRLCAPSLEPLPTRLHDADTRARRRHLDLLVNPAAAATLRLRALLLREMRAFFEEARFLEVQTPILADLAGGAVARPFVTVHESESADGCAVRSATSSGSRALSLRIAPELWLKRLVVGGLDRVFEIGPSFRNEGIDATHNPEFTTCEFYAAYWNLPRLLAETERLLARLAHATAAFRQTPAGYGLRDGIVGHGEEEGAHQGTRPSVSFSSPPSFKSADLCAGGGPFTRLEFVPALETALGFTMPDLDAPDALEQLRQRLTTGDRHTWLFPSNSDSPDLPKLLDRLAAAHLEPHSASTAAGPLFIMHHPACMSPLAKSFVCPKTGQRVAARAELFVDGRELANMYEEENDPFQQRRKMERQGEAQGGDETAAAVAVDNNYIAALEAGLPPTGGWGCGVERLVMLFSGARRIADCLSFGTLRHVVASRE